MPEEKKIVEGEQSKGSEEQKPKETAEKPAAKAEEAKPKLESQVAGMRAEIDKLREKNRNMESQVAEMQKPAKPETDEDEGLATLLTALPAEEQNVFLAERVEALEAEAKEAKQDARYGALQTAMVGAQERLKPYGIELDKDAMGDLVQWAQERGYQHLEAAAAEKYRPEIEQHLVAKGAEQGKGQEALAEQARSESAAPSISAVGQGENEQAKKEWDTAAKLGLVSPTPPVA